MPYIGITRYRDVPWEEICKAHKTMPDHPNIEHFRKIWENEQRGKPITIIGGPHPGFQNPIFDDSGCQVVYDIEELNGAQVCPHLALIGDQPTDGLRDRRDDENAAWI